MTPAFQKLHKPEADSMLFLWICGEIVFYLVIPRNRMDLKQSQAFYLLINNSGLASMSLSMAEVYKDHKDEDGFLYMTYASQEMFGSDQKEKLDLF